MNKIVYAFLVGTASANLQNWVECDSIGDGSDSDNQYEDYNYIGDDCVATNTVAVCMEQVALLDNTLEGPDGKKTCVVRYQGCSDPNEPDTYDATAADCYIYTQTPAAGEEAADWDPRRCLDN